MESLYVKKSVFTSFLVFSALLLVQAQSSSLYFDLDACNATTSTGANMDYSEFTPQTENSTCAGLEVLGGYLYRNNPAVNKHSCTPGVNGGPAMCISSQPSCTFTPAADEALRIDFVLSPGINGNATLSELSFYEKAPEQYVWINGPSGPNNYPTLFGVRILKNGVEVFLSTNIATELTWNLNTFNFSGPEFTVSEPTIFNIELLPYCPIGNGAPVSAWDIDEITIVANCCDAPNGGTLTGGPFEFCVGDGIPDYVSGVVLSGNTGTNSQWVITNDSNMILLLPASLDSVSFDDAGPGVCLIWNISFFDTPEGLIPGNNLLTDVTGCFDLSNPVTVIRNQPIGGTLTGGPFDFCVGDSIPDYVSGVVLSGNVGLSQWVITDGFLTILSLPASLDSVNFDGAGQGMCLIWNISYFYTLEGLIPGNNLVSDVTGCFDLSNPITVDRNQPEGGTLTGGPFEFCVGDGIPDYVSGVVLSDNPIPNSQWVITNDSNVILSLPASLDSVNFDGAGQGACLIWNISYFDTLSGLVPGNNLLTDVTGCFDLSNSITVNRNQPEGGILTGGPFEFCVGDGIPDYVSGVVLSGNTGANSQWVITNDSNMILLLPASLDSVSFDDAGPGVCFIWNISSFYTLEGLTQGNNLLTDVIGCFDLSNAVTVIRNQPVGGILTGGPFEFCVGDSIPDYVSGVVLSGNVGLSQWVITDESITILSLPASLDSVNFDGAGQGMCLIWNISYFFTLEGLTQGNNLISDVTGCFDLSNPVTVVRNQPEGGELTGGPFEFCAGDSITDVTSIILTGNVGSNSQWVVTNELNIIVNLSGALDEIDFGGNGPGVFLIRNISYFDTLSGLVIGNNLFEEVTGCSGISDSVIVVLMQPDGGTLTGGPFEFCVGDSIPDHVSGIVLSGQTGENSQWVITDDANNILSLPASPDSVNFDGAGPGMCLIWNVSYDTNISGLEVGNNLLTDLVGCFGISNSLSVIRNQPEGGTLTGGPFEFCVGDGISDYVSGVVLSGNTGANSQWVITNDSNMILLLPVSLDSVSFDDAGVGVCLIWNISYFDTPGGLIPGNNLLTDVTGCFDLSNAVTVIRNQPIGGTLTGGPFDFCVGDSIPDYVSGVVLSGNVGSSSQWVITNASLTILSLPASLDSVNFDGAGQGMCLIWNITYDGLISGLVPGNNLVSDVTGCFALSNPITVNRNQPEGGELTGGPFEFCVGDSIPDYVTGIELSGDTGGNSQWVITDDANNILSLPASLDSVNFDVAGQGACLIWNISYFDTLSGLVPGNNLLTDVTGCFDLSNPITVNRNQPEGGELTGGPFDFCVGDSIADHVSGVLLTGEVGANSQYVITDSLYTILNLPTTPEEVNFDEAAPGTCFIVHVSYDGPLTGLEVGNNLLTELEGCFSISNSLSVIRMDCESFQGEPIFEMKISPNPVRDVMKLQMVYNGEDIPVVQIFDASGRLCFQQQHDSHSDMSIDMNNFSAGCYFIRVQSALGNKTTSIVVVK